MLYLTRRGAVAMMNWDDVNQPRTYSGPGALSFWPIHSRENTPEVVAQGQLCLILPELGEVPHAGITEDGDNPVVWTKTHGHSGRCRTL